MKPKDPPCSVVVYQTQQGALELKGDPSGDTIWANINQIADLFGVKKAAISKHLRNIYESGELEQQSTVSILETVQTEGKRKVKRDIEFYNLDAILSVGYRVNSQKGYRRANYPRPHVFLGRLY
jgi:hypothetical protein